MPGVFLSAFENRYQWRGFIVTGESMLWGWARDRLCLLYVTLVTVHICLKHYEDLC